ncbi:hypothetical protein ACX80E_01115 [Arthrobacter sp. TMN-49]
MNHVEHPENLVKLLELLLKAHRKNWLSSDGLVACLKRELATADNEPTTSVPTKSRNSHIGGEFPRATAAKLSPAAMLARKINLLLVAIMSDSGKPYDYPAVQDGAQKVGVDLSRTRWQNMKAGKESNTPKKYLLALAAVFGIDPDYLVREDGEIPEQVRAELRRSQIQRRAEVRLYAARSLEILDPEALEAITAILAEVS